MVETNTLLLNQASSTIKLLDWSARLRSSCIRVQRKTITCTQSNAKSRCCFGHDIITNHVNRLYKWSIKIKRLRKAMFVGMGQSKQAHQKNFRQWNWWDCLGHGHYCIGSGGNIFSHSDPEANDKMNPYQFKAGDVLHFQYDTTSDKLSISSSSDWQFEMNIKKGAGQKYSVCAYLYDCNDSIQLIHP